MRGNKTHLSSVTKGHRNKEPGWGGNGGKLYVWRKKRERQQRWTLKKGAGEGGEHKSRISKLPLAQGSGSPPKQYNYKVGLKQTKDLVTSFLLAIASKSFLLVAGLLTKTVCLIHGVTYRENWFQSVRSIKWYALVVLLLRCRGESEGWSCQSN